MTRMIILGATLVVCVAVATGCSSIAPYQSVDLSKNLSPETLQRYEKEWQDLKAAGHEDSSAVLESSNWWPLGLVAYHRDASVMRMPGSDGPTYMVMSGVGLGPLSVLYAGSTHATFNAKGERVSMMKMGNYLWMHLAMTHASDTVLPNGRREKMSSMALFMHALNIQKMGKHMYISIFTLPNAIGANVTAGHAGH